MTTDSDSYDIELAVDKLSDRLFGERKGNLFLSVIGCCKRILYSSDVKVCLVSQCVQSIFRTIPALISWDLTIVSLLLFSLTMKESFHHCCNVVSGLLLIVLLLESSHRISRTCLELNTPLVV